MSVVRVAIVALVLATASMSVASKVRGALNTCEDRKAERMCV